MLIERKLIAVGAVVLAMMTMAAAVPYRVHTQLVEVMDSLSATAGRERTSATLLDTLNMAAICQRAYLVSGKSEFLLAYRNAVAALAPIRARLHDAAPDSGTAPDDARVQEETGAVLSELDTAIRSARRPPAAGAQHLEHLRRLVRAQIAADDRERLALRERLSQTSTLAVDSGIGAAVLCIVLLLPVLAAARRTLRDRAAAREHAHAAAQALRRIADAAEEHGRFLAECSCLLNLLQSAETMDETSRIVGSHLPRIFPGLQGALYMYRNSREVLERHCAWGGMPAPQWIAPRDCWALRCGGPHLARSDDVGCDHASAGNPTLCVPLVSHGDVIGVLHLDGVTLPDAWDGKLRDRVVHFAGQFALGLANVELRERLRLQSWIDPLTQLYNRRYLNDAFRRELARARRQHLSLSIVMIDLDHFKRVNDNHGHEAGDALLSAVGTAIREAVREIDAACRYGGEEFLLLLPDCSYGDALARAEDLRARIAAIRQRAGAPAFPPPTASLGVASFPMHGNSDSELVAAADAALYRAKQGGRDRVCGASGLRGAVQPALRTIMA